jgi:hypothetical protein
VGFLVGQADVGGRRITFRLGRFTLASYIAALLRSVVFIRQPDHLDEIHRLAHIACMERLEPIDSPNRAVRVIERWKRGVGVLICVGLMGILPAVIAFAAGLAFKELLELNGLWVGLPVIAAAIAGPWCIGQRKALRTIGSFADISDNS